VTATSLTGTCHELIARDHPAHRAVADMNEERFVGDGRKREHAIDGVVELDAPMVPLCNLVPDLRDLARHFRRLAEQNLHRHRDGLVAELAIADAKHALGSELAEHGIWTTLARANRGERIEPAGLDAQHVPLLRLVAPQLHRAHAGLVVRHLAQLERSAAAAVVDDFGHGVRKPARADVVNSADGVVRAERPARIDDLLSAALHLGIAALY
jgi:hypothetical protein